MVQAFPLADPKARAAVLPLPGTWLPAMHAHHADARSSCLLVPPQRYATPACPLRGVLLCRTSGCRS